MGVLVIDERTLALVILFLVIFCIILLIRAIFRFIKWILTSIWYLLTGRRHRRNNALHSKDWLTRAQARQEIRFQNSLPQVLASEMEPKKKRKWKK